jgi:lipid II:glycine glycyltransferase (peptidoglycan interpeptide bridge formation enzyme)
MANWQLLTDEEARSVWDEALLRFDDYTPFQTYAWGEYRRALGWEPCRWAAFDESGQIVALMLGLLRRYPFKFGLVWSEGGPVGDLSLCDESLHETIKATTGLTHIYCRFRCDRERRTADALQLSAKGWNRAWFNLTSSYSMTLNLQGEEKQLLAACDQNWRRNLRRANESKLAVRQWLDPDVDEVLAVYTSMQSLKGLEEQHSREEVEHLLKHFRQRLVLYRCDDEQGELTSLLGWVIVGNRAWALFWATSEPGRKLHASYAIFWAVVQHCRRIEVECCDLAGIDPVKNHGVYRFKKATGAVAVEYLGEWDWASSAWMRWLGNWAISRRERLQRARHPLRRAAADRLKRLPGIPGPNEQLKANVAVR